MYSCKKMKRITATLTLLALLPFTIGSTVANAQGKGHEADVVIYGPTSAAIAAVVNDAETPSSVVEKPKVTIQVDLDARTYGVTLDGKTYAGLPFDDQGPIDLIRFIAHSCGNEGLPRSFIDDVVITKGQ